jgi:hypothetical protein
MEVLARLSVDVLDIGPGKSRHRKGLRVRTSYVRQS